MSKMKRMEGKKEERNVERRKERRKEPSARNTQTDTLLISQYASQSVLPTLGQTN